MTRLTWWSCWFLLLTPFTWIVAEEAAPDLATARQRAIDFLQNKAQQADGSYGKNPAVTALITTSLLRSGKTVHDPVIAKSLKYLEGFVQADGGIYAPGSNTQNYETCLALMCFVAANQDGHYANRVKEAEGFLKNIQWDEGEGKATSDTFYGGAGYGHTKRPDLSNTQFLIDALHAAGEGPDDPAIQKALTFVSRCQNLESEHNVTAPAAKNQDGGFFYTIAGEPESKAGKDESSGGLRSYGSMSYAGLKSMIHAGVKADDPRVKAVKQWLAKNWDLSSNPGMGTQGLYYYYHTMAKALAALECDTFTDATGKAHDWRKELATELISRQKPDGSWVNQTDRWMEGDPALVTGYGLLVLSYCQEPKP